MTQPELFIELANPDKEGKSMWVYTTEFTGKYSALKLGNVSTYSRKVSTLDKKYIIETKKEKTRIIAICLNGLKSEYAFNQTIRQDIKDTISRQACVMLGTINSRSVNMKIEVDHKDGRKNDDRVSDTSTQTLEDFQPLCKAANDFKRQKCKEYKDTNKRWSAK